jgi:peptidoglycan-associated lipoprotein
MVALFIAVSSLACGGRGNRPAATPQPPAEARPPAPPPESPAPEPPARRSQPADALSRVEESEDILSRSLEDINAASPLEDIYFEFDSADLTSRARSELESHATWLRRYPTVTVLIEGHCDERGTVEYNLALGERRASAVYNYLLSLGVPARNLKSISYGKEFPLDPAHNEAAWARNRRCHFVITSK